MAIAQQPPSHKSNSKAGQQGGLSRSLVRTLLVLSLIPLILIGGAAFLRLRTFLHDEAINQTQAIITSQIAQMDLVVEAKNARLAQLINNPDLAGQIKTVLNANPQSAEFGSLRTNLEQELLSFNPGEAQAAFSDFVLMRPDGSVLLASRPSWEGTSLKASPSFDVFSAGNDQSYLIYNVPSLYPNRTVLATIVPYLDPGGSTSAALIGFSETRDLPGTLQSMGSFSPSASAYFMLPAAGSTAFIGVDTPADQLVAFQPPADQDATLTSALNSLMSVANPRPRLLEFNISKGHSALAQVAWSDALHSGLALQVEQNAIYGPLNGLIPFGLALFLLLILGMGIVFSTGAARVFRPLVALTDLAHRFSEGDFSQRAEVGRKDEVGSLAKSFNLMAEDLTALYRSLEEKVEERTRQIRTAAEVAQKITSSTNIEEILNRTVQLIVEQFGFYQANAFMLDRAGKVAMLHASYGPASKEMLAHEHRLGVGSASVIGWVCANNQPRIASDAVEDPMRLANELLPETRFEVVIPISVAGLVLGALDVYSKQAGVVGPETIVMFQILASQIAVAIQNVGLAKSTQIDFEELERLHGASQQIAAANSKEDALQTTARVLTDTPYPAVVLSVNDNQLEVAGLTEVNKPEILRIRTAVKDLEIWLERGTAAVG